jgi:hypothetical protein
MVALLAAGFVAIAIVSWRFFFIAPLVTELLIAGFLFAAFVALPKRSDVAGA